MRRNVLASIAAALLLLLAPTAFAQLPVPSLTWVYPSGGKAGSTIDVQISGGDLDDAHRLVFSHAGIVAKQKTTPSSEFEKTPLPLANTFAVQIAPNVPPGLYEVRAYGRFGVSTSRLFAVDTLNEVVDNGNNRSPSTPQEVKVPSIINGRVEASNRDYYKLTLSKGERVLVESVAQRIDSRLDPTLILFDEKGNEMSRCRDDMGEDALIDFTAPSAGNYLIAIHDAIYNGSADYFYRLRVHRDSHVDFVFPPAGLAGSTATYKVYGRNLPNSKPAAGVVANRVPLEVVDAKFSLPANPSAVSTYSPARGALLDMATVRFGARAIQLGLAHEKPVLEAESNNEASKAQKISIPCEVMGQFYPARDVDWTEFEAKKGDVYWLDMYSHRLGLEVDPTLLLYRVNKGKDGKETMQLITQVDDPGDRNAIGGDFDVSTDDPSYRFTAPADGKFRVMVQDQFGGGRSDPRLVYRLAIRKEKPRFRLVAISKQLKVANNNQVLPYSVSLRQGSTRLLQISIRRLDGFAGDVTIAAEGLPSGVSCPSLLIGPASSIGYLVFEAADNAKAWVGPIRIVGKATINGKPVTAVARGVSVTWSTANRTQIPADFRATYDTYLAVSDREKGPALAKIDDKVFETSKGGKLEIPIALARRGVSADVKFVANGVPGEIKPPDVTIKKGAKAGKVMMSITNAKAKSGVYSFYLRSDTKFKYSRNPDAVKRAEARQKIIVDAIKSLAADVKKTTVTQAANNKAAQSATTAHTQAQAKEKPLAAAHDQATKASVATQSALTAAEKGLAGKPTDGALKEKLAAAKKAADAAKQKLQASKVAVETAKAKTAGSKKALDAANLAKTKVAADLKALQDKQKRATALKGTLDKQVAAAKKANVPKDVNIALISTAIRVRIVDTPLKLTLTKPAAEVNQNAKVAVPVKIDRLYGFADAVNITIKPAKNIKGLAGKLQLKKGQSVGNLEVSAAANATVGEHTIPIVAEATFNKIKVSITGQLRIKVVAAAKPKPPAKKKKK